MSKDDYYAIIMNNIKMKEKRYNDFINRYKLDDKKMKFYQIIWIIFSIIFIGIGSFLLSITVYGIFLIILGIIYVLLAIVYKDIRICCFNNSDQCR